MSPVRCSGSGLSLIPAPRPCRAGMGGMPVCVALTWSFFLKTFPWQRRPSCTQPASRPPSTPPASLRLGPPTGFHRVPLSSGCLGGRAWANTRVSVYRLERTAPGHHHHAGRCPLPSRDSPYPVPDLTDHLVSLALSSQSHALPGPADPSRPRSAPMQSPGHHSTSHPWPVFPLNPDTASESFSAQSSSQHRRASQHQSIKTGTNGFPDEIQPNHSQYIKQS